MAKAPRPGASKRREQADQAATVLRIRIRDQEWTLCPGNLSITERAAVRKQTGGVAFETYWNGEAAIGIDSVIVLWWLARRAAGETSLRLEQAEKQWNELDVEPDELELEQVDEVDDDEALDSPES